MAAIVPFLWAGLNHFVKKKTKNFNVEKAYNAESSQEQDPEAMGSAI